LAANDSPHTFSRFDGDLGEFRQLVLDMGQLACEQVMLGARAVNNCDIDLAQEVRVNFRQVRDIDMDLLEANVRLLAIHHPVAIDLRFMMMFARTAYDLERVNREALKLADLAELHYESKNSRKHCELFDDVMAMGTAASDLLARALESVAKGDVDQGIEVINGQQQIERISQGAQRRLATYIMQDPSIIQWVIDASNALKGLERVADHATSIAMNLIFACSGKDVRHANILNLNDEFLQSPSCN